MKKLILATLVLVVLFVLAVSLQAANSPVPRPKKSIVIYLLSQSLACYENDRIVYTTRICTGRGWHNAKRKRYKDNYWMLALDGRGAKARCVVRGKYNCSTPWKMLLSESPKGLQGKLIRLHEFNSVPRRPASHGCIRLPKGKGKPIYEWAKGDLPVPIHIKLAKAPKQVKKAKPKPPPKLTVEILSNQQPKRFSTPPTLKLRRGF